MCIEILFSVCGEMGHEQLSPSLDMGPPFIKYALCLDEGGGIVRKTS